jgi:hypothetical protein
MQHTTNTHAHVGSSITVHPSDAASVFPSFLILPPTLSPGPVLHIRPARIGESVPPPPSATSEGGTDVTMEEARWLSAEWVLEAVPNDDGNGLVVRRSCFAPGSNGRAVGTWDGAAKVENMLVSSKFFLGSGAPCPGLTPAVPRHCFVSFWQPQPFPLHCRFCAFVKRRGAESRDIGAGAHARARATLVDGAARSGRVYSRQSRPPQLSRRSARCRRGELTWRKFG